MKNLLSDILETKTFALTGKGLLFHFPTQEINSPHVTLYVNTAVDNGRNVSLQEITAVLNNQRNQQSNQQQQNRMT